MSFYGNVFYELTNAFATIAIKNSGKSLKSFINPGQDIELPAAGLEGKVSIDTGNKWINLQGSPEELMFKVYHSKKDENDKSNNVESVKIPAAAPNNAVELKPGDYLQINKFFYDDAGHVTTSGTSDYYRLPISDTDKDMTDLQERMDALEKDQSDVTNAFEQLEVQVKNNDTQLIDLEKVVGKQPSLSSDSSVNIIDAIGNVDSLNASIVETIGDMSYLNKNSIVETIGNMNDLNKDSIVDAIGNMNELSDNHDTIVQAIGNMKELNNTDNIVQNILTVKSDMKAQSTTIDYQGIAIKNAIEKLVEALNDQGINIDFDSLWEV